MLNLNPTPASELVNPWDPNEETERDDDLEQVVVTDALHLDGDRRLGIEYRVGDDVEVLEGGLNIWSPATISAIRSGWFEIVFEDATRPARLAYTFQIRQRR